MNTLKRRPKPVLVAKNGHLFLKTRLCDGPRYIKVEINERSIRSQGAVHR